MGLFGSNPAKSAQPFLEKINQLGTQQLSPYGYGGDVYNQQVNNPAEFINNLRSQYQESPGYKFKKDLLMRELGNNNVGYRGTYLDNLQHAELASGIANQDINDWLNQVLGQYNFGQEHQQAGANQYADYLGSNYGQQGELAYKGAESRNSKNAAFTNALMQLFGTLGGSSINAGQGLFGFASSPFGQ